MKLLIVAILGMITISVSGDDVAFKESVTSFSAKLYKELANENSDNFLVCPLSSELVLALVLNGAKGQTAQQLASATSLPNNLSQLNEIIQPVIPEIQSDKTFTLKIVNKMYIDNDVTLKEGFAKVAQNIFQSSVDSVDFSNKQASVNQINKWASDNTEHKINDLLTTQDVKDNTKAVLLNAIFFQATWAKRFHNSDTSKKNFYSKQNAVHPIDMMEQTNTFEYHKCGRLNAQFLKMSYLGSDISMVIALPNEKDGLNQLETNIQEVLNAQKYEFKKVHVVFPKFTMDNKIKMKPLLQKLGVVDLFESSADLNGISDRPLYISEVVQKNYIEVNEKGTIAASATAAIAGVGAGYNPEEPIDFVVDHPFIYYIVSPAGIMFVGRYLGPQ